MSEVKYRILTENTWRDVSNIEDVPENALYEIIAISPTEDVNHIIEDLSNTVVHLTKRVYELALDKTGSLEYLRAQRELYEQKVGIAKGDISDPFLTGLLETEAIQEGVPIELYRDAIISKWDSTLPMFNKHLMMIERGRTKIITLIEQGKLTQARYALNLTENLFDSAGAEDLLTTILELN